MSSGAIFLMSIVYAISDVLPLSSSGHILLVDYLSSECEKANNLIYSLLKFAIFLAILIFFRKQLFTLGKTIIAMVKDLKNKEFSFKTKDNDKKKTLIILTAIIPTLFFFLIKNLISSNYYNLLVTSIGFVIVGVLMIVCDKEYSAKNEIRKVSYTEASSIGILQLFSVIPGVSSIGMVLFGSVINKIKREDAVDITFIASMPIMLISLIKSVMALVKNQDYLNVDMIPYIIATVVAGLIAYFTIMLFKKLVLSRQLKYISIYLFILAVFTFLIWLRG